MTAEPIIASVRGTGESRRRNMCTAVTRDLGVDVIEVDYPAEIRPIGLRTLAESATVGRAALRELDARGEPWAGAAYSLGALTLGDYVMLDRPKHCIGIVLLADPLRSRNQVAHGGVPANRFGIAGERFISGVEVHSFAIPDDPMTSCPHDNGARAIADRVTGRRQPLPTRWWDAGYTLQWASKYLAEGRHVAYGIEKMPGSNRTYVEAARDALREMLR